MPATEITSRHGLDKRSLLPLAARARCRREECRRPRGTRNRDVLFCGKFPVALGQSR